jgi:hypothetical protein
MSRLELRRPGTVTCDNEEGMSFCDHCHGQRFDRSRVLRELRQMRRRWFREHGGACDQALAAAVRAVRDLDIPHLDSEEEIDGELIH